MTDCHTLMFSSKFKVTFYPLELFLTLVNDSRVSQALIMGTATIANALAFTPNFQKGLTSAAKVLRLINRTPKVTDAADAKEKLWVR